MSDDDDIVAVEARPRRSSRHRRPGETVSELSRERTARNQLVRRGLRLYRDRGKYRTSSHRGGYQIAGSLVYGADFELSLDQVEAFATALLRRRVLPEMLIKQLAFEAKRRAVGEQLRATCEMVANVAVEIKNGR
jgi:hypothetical protein